MYKRQIEYIGTRHEAIASTAADGYARITHKASVVMCHLGPGLTNVLTGVANASLDSIPMVVIAGDVPSYYSVSYTHLDREGLGEPQRGEIVRHHGEIGELKRCV